jgi:hypothetical protein
MKTKGLTWQEVLALPLKTKVRLPWWNNEEKYIYFLRKDDGIITYDSYPKGEMTLTCYLAWQIQDQWEVYQEPKKEREYMTGLEAIKAVYEGHKVALDEIEWLSKYGFIYLDKSAYDNLETKKNIVAIYALTKKDIDQKKWYIITD